jgi:hypothetical protein
MIEIHGTADIEGILRSLGRDDISATGLHPGYNGDGVVFTLARRYRRLRVMLPQRHLVDMVSVKNALMAAIVTLNASASLWPARFGDGVEIVAVGAEARCGVR